MKKGILSLVFALVFSLVAIATEPINSEKKEVKIETSKVTWKAYKVTGSHYGSIALKAGSLLFDEEKLVGGEFTVNMTTISTEDLKGDSKEKLDGHLNSADFFDTANHSTSTLTFTEVKLSEKNSYKVTGNLTIKGITKPITFNISVNGNTATATLKVNRTKYDVKYGSTLFGAAADKAIYDEFDLVVDLEF